MLILPRMALRVFLPIDSARQANVLHGEAVQVNSVGSSRSDTQRKRRPDALHRAAMLHRGAVRWA
ncbi:MAG: hypothetical protein SFY96_07425 [Planctomycetota bacterium]|nr:hypothetical protein [Planctomycetota bacterium]